MLLRRLSLSQMAAAEPGFEKMLGAQKAAHPEIGWYPYDTLGAFTELLPILSGERRYPLDLIGNDPILDLGAGDGDLAFLLASLGFDVDAADWPPTNYNGMRGIRRRRELMPEAGHVGIYECDLDGRFELPRERYSLTLALGLLYHIRNPFYLLDTLARHSKYLLLSTRVARTVDGETDISNLPLAYLAGKDEVNRDATNYWIFSECGLKRLLSRAHWEICDFGTVGHTERSNPRDAHRDERAYCFARSRLQDGVPASTRLLTGWYSLEDNQWRWTAQSFSALITRPPLDEAHALKLDFTVPELLLAAGHEVFLRCAINGQEAGEQRIEKAGPQGFQTPVERFRGPEDTKVEFTLSHSFRNAPDKRELGVIVMGLELG